MSETFYFRFKKQAAKFQTKAAPQQLLQNIQVRNETDLTFKIEFSTKTFFCNFCFFRSFTQLLFIGIHQLSFVKKKLNLVPALVFFALLVSNIIQEVFFINLHFSFHLKCKYSHWLLRLLTYSTGLSCVQYLGPSQRAKLCLFMASFLLLS